MDSVVARVVIQASSFTTVMVPMMGLVSLPCGALPVKLLHHRSLFTIASNALGNIKTHLLFWSLNTELTGIENQRLSESIQGS